MDHFLTSQVFKSGLTRYLKRHKYSNAEQDDLWQALTEQAHEDQVLPKDVTVKTIMDTWTLQTGFPVVTVTRNYGDNTAAVVQVGAAKQCLDRSGFNCLLSLWLFFPFRKNFYSTSQPPTRPRTSSSRRHCGGSRSRTRLRTFSISSRLIRPSGCAGRSPSPFAVFLLPKTG